jgi:hypothetical protein
LLLLLLLLAASFYRSCMAHLQELLARDMAKGQPRFKTLQHACWLLLLLLLLLQLLAGSSCWRARLLLLHRGYVSGRQWWQLQLLAVNCNTGCAAYSAL